MKAKTYVVLAVIVALTVGIVLLAPSIKRQLNDWKLLPQPERLTELYFTHPNSLPSNYTASQAQAVDFTVHNLEYRTETYSYTIVEATEPGQTGVTLARGNFTLKQGDYKKVTERIILQPLASRVNVDVNLTNVNESVDYWLTRQGA
jgi:uncharacterized membrane protein